MAKINFGNIVQDARGSIGGITYSRNASGAYARQKVSPVQPISPWSSQVRQYFRELSSHWSNVLEIEERNAWIAFALLHPVIDVFGNSVILGGLAMYQRCNRVIQALGGTLLVTPPPNLDVTALTSQDVAITAAGGVVTEFDLSVTPIALGTDEYLYVFATPPLGAGIGNFARDLRLINDPATPFAPGADAVDEYNSRFPDTLVAAGDQIGFRLHVGNDTTGALSPGLIGRKLVG